MKINGGTKLILLFSCEQYKRYRKKTLELLFYMDLYFLNSKMYVSVHTCINSV